MLPYWPDSDEPPLDRAVMEAHLRKTSREPISAEALEERLASHERAAVSQRVWLAQVRGVELVWR